MTRKEASKEAHRRWGRGSDRRIEIGDRYGVASIGRRKKQRRFWVGFHTMCAGGAVDVTITARGESFEEAFAAADFSHPSTPAPSSSSNKSS